METTVVIRSTYLILVSQDKFEGYYFTFIDHGTYTDVLACGSSLILLGLPVARGTLYGSILYHQNKQF